MSRDGLGTGVLSLGCVNAFLKNAGVQPVWVAREEARELIVEQFGADAWGAGIPSRFRLVDVPKFLVKMWLLRKRAGDLVCVLSPGKSARLAMSVFPKKDQFGYVDWHKSGRCLGVDGVWRRYDVTQDHLVSRAARVLCPKLIENQVGPVWENGCLQPVLSRMNGPAALVDAVLRDTGLAEKPFVLFSIGARWVYRRWILDGWVDLARGLIVGGHTVVLCGTPSEQVDLVQIQREVGDENCVLLPSLSVPEFVELGRVASCMVTLDSGPMHVAAAVKTPCIALYGPSEPALTVGVAGPGMMQAVRWDGCMYWPCIDPSTSNDGGGCRQGAHSCMRNLSVDRVLQAVEGMLER